MNFRVGQVFENTYPPEAAMWCNEGNGYIEQQADGTFIIKARDPAPEPTYADLRLSEYPSVGDQLDMIYHDQVDGTNKWVQTIRYIKEKYPKE